MFRTILPEAAYYVFGAVYVAMLGWHLFLAIRRRKRHPEGRPFRFHTLDMVAAIFGITPTLWQVSLAVKAGSIEDADVTTAWTLVGAFAVSQLIGLFFGRILGTCPPQPSNEWLDAIWILGGALYGLLLFWVSFIAFAILYGAALLLLAAGPAFAILIGAFVAGLIYFAYTNW